MSQIKRIRSAEDTVELAQEALTAVHSGLEAAEVVDAVVGRSRAVCKTVIGGVVVLGLVSLVVYLIRRRNDDE